MTLVKIFFHNANKPPLFISLTIFMSGGDVDVYARWIPPHNKG